MNAILYPRMHTGAFQSAGPDRHLIDQGSIRAGLWTPMTGLVSQAETMAAEASSRASDLRLQRSLHGGVNLRSPSAARPERGPPNRSRLNVSGKPVRLFELIQREHAQCDAGVLLARPLRRHMQDQKETVLLPRRVRVGLGGKRCAPAPRGLRVALPSRPTFSTPSACRSEAPLHP